MASTATNNWTNAVYIFAAGGCIWATCLAILAVLG